MHAETSEHPGGLFDELLGGTWSAPDEEDYPHEAVAEIQALLADLVADLSRP